MYGSYLWYNMRGEIKPPQGALRELCEIAYNKIMTERDRLNEAEKKTEPHTVEQVPLDRLGNLELENEIIEWRTISLRKTELEEKLRAARISIYHSYGDIKDVTRPVGVERDPELVKRERLEYSQRLDAIQKSVDERVKALCDIVRAMKELKLKAVRVQLPEDLQAKLEAL